MDHASDRTYLHFPWNGRLAWLPFSHKSAVPGLVFLGIVTFILMFMIIYMSNHPTLALLQSGVRKLEALLLDVMDDLP